MDHTFGRTAFGPTIGRMLAIESNLRRLDLKLTFGSAKARNARLYLEPASESKMSPHSWTKMESALLIAIQSKRTSTANQGSQDRRLFRI